jgi:hypothetical protein
MLRERHTIKDISKNMKRIKSYQKFRNKLFENNSEIEAICQKYFIENYTINPDGSIDVDGDVILTKNRPIGSSYIDFKLDKLPLKFRKVTGDFDCRSNKLTSLEGAPEYVGGVFDCSHNQLETLEGGPKEVVKGYICWNNKLKSLEGCAQIIGTPENLVDFNCSMNQLTSLVGMPQEICASVSCGSNKLKDLTGCPKKIWGSLSCDKNQIESLQGAPDYIGTDFSCDDNLLRNLEGFPKEIGNLRPLDGGNVYIRYNRLELLRGGPEKIKANFFCNNNLLTSFGDSPIMEIGVQFNCSNNKLESLSGCPKEIGTGINFSKNNIKKIFLEDLEFVDFGGAYGQTTNNPVMFNCEGNPIFEIFKIFGDHKSFVQSLDYNYFNESDVESGNETPIIRVRLEDACEEFSKELPEKIEGYQYI